MHNHWERKRLRRAHVPRVENLPGIQLWGTLRGSPICEVTRMFRKPVSFAIFHLGFLLVFCMVTLALAVSAHAQIGNATLGGTVMDPSGAAVGDAQLTLTNRATGFEARATSNERGEYTFRNVTPGSYDLKVVKAGFQNYVQKDIVLTINETGHADATLKVGATTETVTVEGENTLINYENATLEGGVDPQTLEN